MYLCSAFFRFIEDHVDQCHRMKVIKAEASTSKLNASPMLDIASRIFYLNRNVTRCPKIVNHINKWIDVMCSNKNK